MSHFSHSFPRFTTHPPASPPASCENPPSRTMTLPPYPYSLPHHFATTLDASRSSPSLRLVDGEDQRVGAERVGLSPFFLAPVRAASISIARWSRPVVDPFTLHGGTRHPPNALGRRGGADDDVHSPHEATQRASFGGQTSDERDVRQAGRSRIECSRLWAVSYGLEATPPRVPREPGHGRGGFLRRLSEQRITEPPSLQELFHCGR